MGEQTHLSRRIYLSTVRLNDVTTRKCIQEQKRALL